MTTHNFPLIEPGMWTDGNGFLRYPQASHDARVQWILQNGQDLSVTVELWLPLHQWQSVERSLFVLELHRSTPAPIFYTCLGTPGLLHRVFIWVCFI